MISVEEKAQEAVNRGEITKTLCDTKQEVLDLIQADKADAISVVPMGFWQEDPILSHYAIRFNDRELGEQARVITMRGFNISPLGE
jgi:hypothetical protein